jgi:hypothetical protein
MARVSKRRARAKIEAGLSGPVRPGRKREKRRTDWVRAAQGELLPYRIQWPPRSR